MLRKLLFTVAFLTFINDIEAQWSKNNKTIKGNGNIISVTRETSNYDAIGIGGSFEVELIKGNEGKITIEGEENIVPYIETNVKRKTLEVKFRKNTNIKTKRKIKITITYDDIETISLAGSGKIYGNEIIESSKMNVSLGGSGSIILNIDAKDISSSIGGSGNIKLNGKSNSFKCNIAGSGSIKAFELKTNILEANISGSGNIKTSVSDKIDAKVVGSGSIYYKGNPRYIDTKSVGSGDVINAN